MEYKFGSAVNNGTEGISLGTSQTLALTVLRRGVGKTDIALEYAYTNPSGIEAIFWIQCETSITLRQSFTDMAVQLNLPGADRNGGCPSYHV